MHTLEYTIYLDALLVLSALLTVVHALTLWSVGRILEIRTSWVRLLIAATLGTIVDCVLVIADLRYAGMPGARAAEFICTAGTLCLACRLSFPAVVPRRLLKACGYTYLFTVVSAGSALAAFTMTGGNPWAARVTAVASLLVLGELGWGVLQRGGLPASLLAEVSVQVDSLTVRVPALVDTGHSLRDPLTHGHVVVVEADSIRPLVPESIRAMLLSPGGERLLSMQSDGGAVDDRWLARVRVLPYVSLGRTDGMLVGFRPDWVDVDLGGNRQRLDGAIVAVYAGQLSREGSYRALLPAEAVSPCGTTGVAS